ncbi:MAG TPA: hypothetical protein PK069_09940 [Methanolinea sp.]|nr:hypothetical protein [Methanolinea sp.]HQK56828.1 hypothetical protein [Methanolinea sp.]
MCKVRVVAGCARPRADSTHYLSARKDVDLFVTGAGYRPRNRSRDINKRSPILVRLPHCIRGCLVADTCRHPPKRDMHALARVAEKERCWFHVDGEFCA